MERIWKALSKVKTGRDDDVEYLDSTFWFLHSPLMLQARRLTICLFCFVDTNFHGSFLQAMEFYQPLVHFVGEYDTSLDGLSYQNKKNVLHRKNLFFLFLAYLKIILQRLAHLFGDMTGSKKGVCPKNFLGDHCLLAPALMFLLCSLGG